MLHDNERFLRALDDEAPAYSAPKHTERENFNAFLLHIVRQAAEDAAGVHCFRFRENDRQEAQRWFMSPAEFGWEFHPEKPGRQIVKGVTFRWICRHLDVDPDLAQEEIRRKGWQEANRAWRSISSTENAKRNRDSSQKARTGSQLNDRRSGGVRVARSAENGATAIVEAV